MLEKYVKKILLCLLVMVFSFIKVAMFFGKKKMFLSGVNLLIPAIGAFWGGATSVLLLFNFFVYKFICGKGMFTLGIPTFFGAMVWFFATRKRGGIISRLCELFFRNIIPCVCISLFMYHSVGRGAFYYSFYWFIPIFLCFLQRKNEYENIFSVALSSTFVTHAVGSVLWLYIVPTSSAYWIALIPRVAIERFIFALGMSVVYICCKKAVLYFSEKRGIPCLGLNWQSLKIVKTFLN